MRKWVRDSRSSGSELGENRMRGIRMKSGSGVEQNRAAKLEGTWATAWWEIGWQCRMKIRPLGVK